MDSFTHMVTGAVLARAVGDERVGNWGTLAGVAMGIFPDSDILFGLFNRESHLLYHRGLTHSLLLVPFFALFFSWVLVKVSKRGELWSFYKICFLVLISHVLIDLLTSYGTMILLPFSDHRYAWDLAFFVDLVFSGIVIVPWLISLFWRRRARWICRASLVVLVLYVLFLWVQHDRAIELAKCFGSSLNEEVVEVASLPQPLSPFRWANYIEAKDKVYQGYVTLLGDDSSRPGIGRAEGAEESSFFLGRWFVMKSLYQPPAEVRYSSWEKRDGSPWVEKALAAKGGKFYSWFARFPIAKTVDSSNGTHRVELTDVRFLVPSIRMPFMYYMELDDSGKVVSEGFAGDRKRLVQKKRSEN
jgi:inner membrane protein